MNEKVQRAFYGYPPHVRERLMALRAVVFDVAEHTLGVGSLEETLKWGEISYLNPAGTTLRIGTVKGSEKLAIFVHCQTSIVDDLRAELGEAEEHRLEFDETRCIRLPSGVIDTPAVRRCIAKVLTYRLH